MPISEDTLPGADTPVRDIAIVETGGRQFAIGSTGTEGTLLSWELVDGDWRPCDSLELSAAAHLGGFETLLALPGDSGATLWTTSGAGGCVLRIELAADGTFLRQEELPRSDGLTPKAVLQLAGGVDALLCIDARGVLSVHALSAGGALAEPFASLAGFDPRDVLVAHPEDPGRFLVATHDGRVMDLQIGAGPQIAELARIDASDGYWASGVGEIEAVSVDGRSFFILAGQASSSLTVIEALPDGGLAVRDHVLDNLLTRFGNPSALAGISTGDRAVILAAGGDDGLSCFELLPDGRLLHRETLEDTPTRALSNLDAVVALIGPSGLQVLAAGSETDLQQLLFALPQGALLKASGAGGALSGGAADDILLGSDRADILLGADGRDILSDGGGIDDLYGGDGADVFVMCSDGTPDRILDFDYGTDMIDLSHWSMLRSIDQLTLSPRNDGFEIVYGEERLTVVTSSGAPLDPETFRFEDFVVIDRIGTGFPSSYPTAPEPAVPIPSDMEEFSRATGVALIWQLGEADVARDEAPPALSADLQVAMVGTAGIDSLWGDIEADLLLGRAGDDLLGGGPGADTLCGGRGNDRLFGGSGQDHLSGGAGDDWIEGGAGNDLLDGGAGADSFVFEGGCDRILDFAPGEDSLLIDAALVAGIETPEELIATFGRVTETGVSLYWNDGTEVAVDGLNSLEMLAADLILL